MKWHQGYLYTKLVTKFILSRNERDPKEAEELAHWIGQSLKRKSNDHFFELYVKEFNLNMDSFAGKRLLDIGCGPTGSLEWANNAAERIGVDPLAKEYLWLGAWKQKMKYLPVSAEELPFADEHFDFIFSFNALDHVEDLEASCKEISRVLAPDGHFILITDCNHPPTITEPTYLPDTLAEDYFPSLEILC
jgi:ubiquinone/menaquinone biosynthesis C-methylase UbiE